MSAGEDTATRTTTAQSRELGAELARVRRRAGLTGTVLAEELGWVQSHLSKLEKGRGGTSAWNIATLLGRCGADKPVRDRIMRLVQQQNLGYFTRPHDGQPPDDLFCLRVQERAAAAISCYEPVLVPALLQSEDYARALLASTADSPDVLAEFVRSRMERQAILRGHRAPESVFYINESALGLVVGSAAIMNDQLHRLAFMCDWTRLTLRVIPAATSGHLALQYPSTMLTFTKDVEPLVYAQSDAATVFLEESRSVQAHLTKHTALAGLALDAEQSREVFTRWASAYDQVQDDDLRVVS